MTALSPETLLLGVALLAPERACKLGVCAPHFGTSFLRRAWEALQTAVGADEPADAVSLAAVLGCEPLELVALSDAALRSGASEHRLPDYAAQVADDALRRSVLAAAATIQHEAASLSGGALLALAQSQLGHMLASAPESKNLRQLLGDYLTQWEALDAQEREGEQARRMLSAPTGISTLDTLLGGGWRRGQTHVLGASTSVGKSALGIGAALAAAKAGHVVDLYSLEDGALATLSRLLAQESQYLPLRDVVDYRPLPDPFQAAAKRLAPLTVHVIDRLPPTLDEFAWQARHRATGHGTTLIVCDYLQKVARKARGQGIYDRATAVSAALFDLARDTNAATVVLSQRNATSDDDNRSLRGAGEIAEDAYSVTVLKREKRYDSDCHVNSETGEQAPIPAVECHVTKSKNGPTGRVLLGFNGARALFEPASRYLIARYEAAKSK